MRRRHDQPVNGAWPESDVLTTAQVERKCREMVEISVPMPKYEGEHTDY
jgi:hypothetical protein